MAVCLDYQSVYMKNEKVVSYKFSIFTALFLMFVLIFHVWVKSETVSLGYDIAEAQNKTAEYNTIKKDLIIQLSVVKRYDNLTNLAKNRLGFVTKKGSKMITVEY